MRHFNNAVFFGLASLGCLTDTNGKRTKKIRCEEKSRRKKEAVFKKETSVPLVSKGIIERHH